MTLFVATCAPAAQTVSTDLEVVPAANSIIRVWRLQLWQTSDLGDAAEEVLDVQWITGHATSGTGGQTTVISAINPAETMSAPVAELFNTTIASTGTPVTRWRDGWNIRIPYNFVWLPEERPIIRAADTRGVFRISAPADAITMAAAITFEQA